MIVKGNIRFILILSRAESRSMHRPVVGQAAIDRLNTTGAVGVG